MKQRRSPTIALTTLLCLLAPFTTRLVRGQAGRVACGASSPNQDICDSVARPSKRGALRLPIRGECTKEPKSSRYYCGFAGAACMKDSQCDFGYCDLFDTDPSARNAMGRCVGGLGDSCQGLDGPDDSLCAGNLACGVRPSDGRAICGGQGAECFYSDNFEIKDEPNHYACDSGYCSPATLTCSNARPAIWKEVKDRQTVFSDNNAGPAQPNVHAHVGLGAIDSDSLRRVEADAPVTKCQLGLTLCPFLDDSGELHHGCFNIRTSRTQCGGCSLTSLSSTYDGRDCTEQPGVAAATCQQGQCRAQSCSSGYKLDIGTRSCVPVTRRA